MYNSNKISSIYWDILKNQLDRHFPSLYFDCMSSTASFADLESIIRVKSSIIAGIESIQQSLDAIGLDLPDDIIDIIIHGETPVRDCEWIRGQIRAKRLSEEEKGEILFRAAAAVHEQRIQDDSIGNGFKKTDVFSRYVYLPIELIGFDNAREDYHFIEGVASALALRTHEFYIKQAYQLAKINFYEKYAIYSPLCETIEMAILCLPPINTEISQSLNNDKKLRRIIVEKILQQ